MGILEGILLGVLVVVVIFWFRPGMKAAVEHSRTAKKDWPAVLIPLAAVVVFVMLLIALVR